MSTIESDQIYYDSKRRIYLKDFTRKLICPAGKVANTVDRQRNIGIACDIESLACGKEEMITPVRIASDIIHAPLSNDSIAASSSACSPMRDASLPRRMLLCEPGQLRPYVVSKARCAASTARSTSWGVPSETDVITLPLAAWHPRRANCEHAQPILCK